LALAVGLAFAVMVFTAQISGHWKSAISDDEFKMFLRMVDSPALIHPTF